MRSLISDFDTPLGWLADDFELLQNRSTQETQPDGVVLENERIANMFEAWVYGRQPDLDGLSPVQGVVVERQIRAAWAMWTFMTGECPPEDVNISLQPSVTIPCGDGYGFLDRILEFGGQLSEDGN